MNIYCKVRKIAEKSGIEKLSPITLRHTFIVQLFKTEQDLRYVQEQTGYNSLRTVAMHVDDHKVVIKRGGSGSVKQTKVRYKHNESKPMKMCEACGTKISINNGKRIDSGQFLCSKCLRYF
jgi:hypothetical protein